MFASRERIGFNDSLYEGRGTWIEFSPAGKLLGKYDLGRYGELTYEPRAMTASGDVYARISKLDRFDGWAVLDRSTGKWRRVSGYPKGAIIGSDGDKLIFAEIDGGWTVLHSVAAGGLKLQLKIAVAQRK